MAGSEGAVEVHVGAPGPWAQRRIAFHATSTFALAPAMEPLNEPIPRAGGGANGLGGGVGHHQIQQQQHFSNQHSSGGVGGGGGVNIKVGKSEPLSLPSSMPLQWTAPQKIGAGLSNLGNTCFLNSVLQCLTYTPPLAGYLQSGQHKASCRVAGFCAFCALQEHVQQALASSGKVVSPQKLAKNLRSICRSFRMGRQEDSHEYMRYLLEALHKCCLPPDLAKNSNSKSSQEKSLVYRIFGGQLRSQVKCTVCSHCSNTYDPFLDLSLEIVRADSLTKALTRFTAVDVLDGDNKYRCLRCKKKVRALKNFTIDLVPNILTIQFKRFSSSGGQGGKIDKKVEFGTTLDLKPFVSNGQDSIPRYKLFGVLVHSGWSTHSGHYYSFLRAPSDIWHVFDDSRVRQVSEKTVLEQKAYMLFYVREVKRVNNSYSEVTPSKQALSLPRQLALLSREKQSNPDSGVTPRHAFTPALSIPPKDKERKPLAEVLPEQPSSESVSVLSKVTEINAHPGVILQPAALQPVGISLKETELCAVQSNGENGVMCDIPTMIDSDPHPAAAVAPILNHSCLEGAKVDLCPPVGEHYDVSVKENCHNKEMEIESCCTTSGNPGFEDDWDEYYKKGWNPPGSTPPQKFLKMLWVIPHTRRYYQARALPVRRASKVVSNGNVEMEIGHPELVENSAPNVNKDAKRPHSFNNDMRGPKRQHRDSGVNCISSTCMASEEFLEKSEPMDVTYGHGTAVQEDSLQSGIEIASEENGLRLDVFVANKGQDDSIVVERQLVMKVENVKAERNGQIETPQDHVKDPLDHRELHNSGAELRVDRNGDNCRASDQSNCESKENTSISWPSSEKVAEMVTGTVIPTASSILYGTSVPRWADGNGNEQSVKEIERLLEPEKSGSFVPDTWDMEYDKGRSKKVRNKTSRETHDIEIHSNGTGNGISKPSNPFQAFGIAKKNGNGVKKGNSIGFKAGYGYSLKTGKNVSSAGPKMI